MITDHDIVLIIHPPVPVPLMVKIAELLERYYKDEQIVLSTQPQIPGTFEFRKVGRK